MARDDIDKDSRNIVGTTRVKMPLYCSATTLAASSQWKRRKRRRNRMRSQLRLMGTCRGTQPKACIAQGAGCYQTTGTKDSLGSYRDFSSEKGEKLDRPGQAGKRESVER